MNNKRSDFVLSMSESSKRIRITPYWLLGFVEGEGSFYITKNKNYRVCFSLGQSSKDLTLIKEIKNFFKKLPGEFKGIHDYDNVVNFTLGKKSEHQHDSLILLIQSKHYITNVLIPLFDSMIWISKKELDYKDWKSVLNLKQLGQHYSKKGVKVLDQILSQMNNKRLSSNKHDVVVDRKLLQIEIDKLLSAPSNFEIKENGRIFIKSLNRYHSEGISIKVQLEGENGLVLNTFDCMTSCAKFLGISSSTVYRKLQNNKAVRQ